MEHHESPTAFGEREVYIEGEAYSIDALEMFWVSHEAAGSVSWTVSTRYPDDALISSPFQTIDERRSEAEKVFELIGLIRRSDDLPFARRLARRLEDLVRIAQEEAPDQSEISSESLRMFYGFVRGHTEFSEPGVVLTPSGNIRAQWRAAPNELCAVEFLRDKRVNFVVFAPDLHDPHQTNRLSGIALPVEDFMGAVGRYGAGRWMGR